MKIIIDEKRFLEIESSAKGATDNMNGTCFVFQENFITYGSVKFNLHMLINGLRNKVYDITNYEENYLQASIGNYLIMCPLRVINRTIDIVNAPFSINDMTKDRSIMDNYDFKYTIKDVLAL